jgi:hypothetical protein
MERVLSLFVDSSFIIEEKIKTAFIFFFSTGPHFFTTFREVASTQAPFNTFQ